MSDSTVVASAGPKRKPPAAGIGRKKGVPNKVTASVKTALTEAFEKRGGVPALMRWANEDPTEFYKLWGRMLPQELHGKDGGPLMISVVFGNE